MRRRARNRIARRADRRICLGLSVGMQAALRSKNLSCEMCLWRRRRRFGVLFGVGFWWCREGRGRDQLWSLRRHRPDSLRFISIVTKPIEKAHTYRDLLHGEETNGSGIFLMSAMHLSVADWEKKVKRNDYRGVISSCDFFTDKIVEYPLNKLPWVLLVKLIKEENNW